FLFLSYEKTSISEMQGWDFSAAFSSYNLALFLFIAGFFLSLSRVYHTGDKVRFFLITWTIVILTSTLLHVRYEYLAVVPVVILASIALASLHTWTKKRIHQSVFCFFGITSGSVNRRVPCMIETHGATILIGILLLVIALLTVSNTLGEINSTVRDLSISDDWVDALEWFQTNTPDSGIDFYAIYEMNNFTYPNTSYGILSWWMYGHWISVISHRIPLASPFQNTVYRVAPFFLSTTEADANNLADEYGIKYVITDFSLTESQFSSLPFWTNGMYQIDRFQFTYSPGNSQSSKAKVVSFKKNDFYQDMIFRLHELDGSFFSGVGGMVVHYDRIENESYSRLINTSIVTALEANLLARKGLPVGQDLVSTKYSLPVCDVPALQTYRLIYESPQTVTVSRNSEVKWVKIFERVPGYVIEGDGTIELPLITNQGRKFVYQQKSENGRFIVPYSTTAAKNRVSATGPYHILETGETFAIPELAI
ncbi:MAG TPA: hypothetical protein VN372_07480, partial [Methanospirillum sp.]|nr:hypothetical protein [Methanospirillum sp.]